MFYFCSELSFVFVLFDYRLNYIIFDVIRSNNVVELDVYTNVYDYGREYDATIIADGARKRICLRLRGKIDVKRNAIVPDSRFCHARTPSTRRL